MPLWLQHLLVLLIVAACVGFVARQMVRTFRLKKSKLGACCAKGCDAGAESVNGKTAAAAPTERVVFFPVEMLTASRRQKPPLGSAGSAGARPPRSKRP
jgi:hypothetical protein